jgi:membrane complex biogenesis BtpA family protein
MVHLGQLPGSPKDGGDFSGVLERAIADAHALEEGGADAVMVENFFDAPFPKSDSTAVTIAAMTLAVHAVRDAVSLPLGVNVLRNDACAALSIAHACGAQFIRCNVYVGAAVTDQGIIEGAARDVVMLRRQLGSTVEIWADIGVKHAVQLGDISLEQSARDAVDRGMADALIASGDATGSATPIERVRAVKGACPEVPVYVGSGLTVDNAADLLRVADGAIVGSSLKKNGVVSAQVDVGRVRKLAEIIHARRH